MIAPRPQPTRAALRWRDIFNAAGVLTAVRLPLAVALPAALPDRQLALGIFIVAGLTDGFDGFIARRTGTGSHTGSMLDGFVDKVFLVNSAWGLAMHDLIPTWWLIPWFVREVVQLVMVPLLWLPFRQGRVFFHQATRTGKATTWAVGLSIFAVLMDHSTVAAALTPLAGALGLATAIQYVWQELADGRYRERLNDAVP